MEMLDLLRFSLGSAMLCYGSWTDLKTRRVPNEVWLISGSIASVLLIYDLSTQDWGYHVWALLFATFVLFYNAFVDEYVLEDNQAMLWRVFQVLAILSALYFLLTVDSEEITSENYKLIDILSISVLMILMYVWYYLGPTIGGADVKAIMTIGLVAPFTIFFTTFSEEPLTASLIQGPNSSEIRGFPYPFVIFMNSLLLYLLIPIGLALYNIVRGNIEKPYFQIFFGLSLIHI